MKSRAAFTVVERPSWHRERPERDIMLEGR